MAAVFAFLLSLFLLLFFFLVIAVNAEPLNFLVLADWGGSQTYPYTTPGESETATVMGTVADQTKASFVLALGENFYLNGVTDVNSPRFRETFEDVFTAPSLNIPWHVIAGNHDHYGNIDAQIQYTGKSTRWHFPSLWYDFVETIPGTSMTVHFVMIDTMALAGNFIDNFATEVFHPSASPSLMNNTPEWQWISATLASSTADYLIVGGHYPVWSVCEHGPDDILVDELLPMLQANKVTAYFFGHDHCNQHIASGDGVDHFGVGAAHGCDPSLANQNSVPTDSLKFHWSSGDGGFAAVAVDEKGLVVKYYTDKGDVVYVSPSHLPRSFA